jgi:pimeloyl-ACP methyl ester carboxylesterase
MYYEEKGSGDPVLLIMGITATGDVWQAHSDHWSEEFRCIMPDNRGVGQTDKPAGDYTSAMMADDYAGLLDALGISQARVVGVSMGCAAPSSCVPGRGSTATRPRSSST